MNNSVAVDTNILIYLHDISDDRKRKISEDILADNPKIPAQVISEYLNVTRRLLNLTKPEIVRQCVSLFKRCEIIPTTHATLTDAAGLIEKYDFQIFDAIVISAALEAGCTVLYSEDMQHGLAVNNLAIVNPFL